MISQETLNKNIINPYSIMDSIMEPLRKGLEEAYNLAIEKGEQEIAQKIEYAIMQSQNVVSIFMRESERMVKEYHKLIDLNRSIQKDLNESILPEFDYLVKRIRMTLCEHSNKLAELCGEDPSHIVY